MRLLENKRHLYTVCRFGESGIVRGEVSVVKQLRFESSYDSLDLPSFLSDRKSVV